MVKAKSKFKVYLLGPFRMEIDGKKVVADRWKSKKALTLFTYFISKRDKRIAKDILIELLWPDSDQDQSGNLHTTIYFLRRTLDPLLGYQDKSSCINYSRGLYWLADSIECWSDCEEFEDLYNRGKELEINDPEGALSNFLEGLSLYRGDFLEDNLYEDWTLEFRRYYQELYFDMALRTVDLLVSQQQNYHQAVEICRQVLEIDPYREEFYHAVISYLIEMEQYIKATKMYHQYAEIMSDEFGLAPDPETEKLFQQLNKVTSRKLSLISQSSTKKKRSGSLCCERDAFELMYELELRRQERTGSFFALIVISINHQNSDGLALEVVEELYCLLRRGDILCLWDEATILIQLFQAGDKETRLIIKRLKQALPKDLLTAVEINFSVINGLELDEDNAIEASLEKQLSKIKML